MRLRLTYSQPKAMKSNGICVYRRHTSRLLTLASLSPRIVAAILAGRQPPEITVETLIRKARFPHLWEGQSQALGL